MKSYRNTDIRIIEATREDSRHIGKAVTMAIGDDLAKELAGPGHSVEDVENLFTSLAARDDSQYSYRNSLLAVDENGNVLGAVVSYDGAQLYTLRDTFLAEAKNAIGFDPKGNLPDETDSEEYYLDSLAVYPEYRGHGIARRLIEEAARKAKESGKPLGLLVSKDNPAAKALYVSLGFRAVGERPFAGELMTHMILETHI